MYQNVEQSMKQLNLHKQKQLQDQLCSNENMSYVFATMESIYFDTTKNPEYSNEIFGYYKINGFELKKLEDKIDQLESQLITYEASVILYVKKNSNYDFPENFNAEKIQSLLNSWKKNKYLRDYCEYIQNLLFNLKKDTEKFNDKIDQQTKTTYSNSNEKQMYSVNTLYNNIPITNNEINNMLKNVEKNYQNNGENTKININTYSNPDKNPIHKNVKHFEKINGKTSEEIMKRNDNLKNHHEDKDYLK